MRRRRKLSRLQFAFDYLEKIPINKDTNMAFVDCYLASHNGGRDEPTLYGYLIWLRVIVRHYIAQKDYLYSFEDFVRGKGEHELKFKRISRLRFELRYLFNIAVDKKTNFPYMKYFFASGSLHNIWDYLSWLKSEIDLYLMGNRLISFEQYLKEAYRE